MNFSQDDVSQKFMYDQAQTILEEYEQCLSDEDVIFYKSKDQDGQVEKPEENEKDKGNIK